MSKTAVVSAYKEIIGKQSYDQFTNNFIRLFYCHKQCMTFFSK